MKVDEKLVLERTFLIFLLVCLYRFLFLRDDLIWVLMFLRGLYPFLIFWWWGRRLGLVLNFVLCLLMTERMVLFLLRLELYFFLFLQNVLRGILLRNRFPPGVFSGFFWEIPLNNRDSLHRHHCRNLLFLLIFLNIVLSVFLLL